MATTQSKAAAVVDTPPAPAAAVDAAPAASTAGLMGRHEPAPAEVATGQDRDALLAAAQEKAPSLTREFADAMGLDDDLLIRIARGEVPPPPTIGPIHTADLYLTPAGWQQTPRGVRPEDVGKDAISR